MESITLDYKNWKAGISTADGVEDGGYSPLYGGHNLQQEKDDLLYPQHAYSTSRWGGTDVTDIMDGNTANPVIYVKSPAYRNSLNSVFGVLVDSENNPYSHDSINRFTDEGGLSSVNVDFTTYGQEDGVAFQDDIYIMADDDIVYVNLDTNGGYSSADSNWWSNTRGHAKLVGEKCISIVVEDTAYFIEKNKVHIWDGSSSQENALTLPPDFYAMAGIKHPNGRDFIVLGTVKDTANKVAGTGYRAYYINTTDLEFTDEVPIDAEVHGIWNVGGTLYVTTYNWLGIFTGTGIEKIYKLTNPLLVAEDSPADDVRPYLIRTHHGTVTDQGYLLIPDGDKVLAIGNVGGGTIMWHIADLSADLTNVHMVFNIGNQYVGVFGYDGDRWTAANLVATQIFLNDHNGAGKWASNKLRFNQKAWVRKIALEFETLESGDDFSVGHIKQDGTEVTLHQITYAKYGAIGSLEIYPNVLTDVFQYLHTWTTGAVGLRKVTIFYEAGE